MKVSMIKYLDNVLQEFSEHLGLTAATLAVAHLFKVQNNIKTKYLPEDQAQTFHFMVAQLMFMSSRAR